MRADTLRVFIGWDHRQPIAYNVLQHSILARASQPVAITPLVLSTLPIERAGLTPFTFSRFLVPWLCGFEGWALFLDIDMLCLGNVAELWALRDESCAVMVSKNEVRFEWPSVMLFNCGHEANKALTPEYVGVGKWLFGWDWLEGSDTGAIGSLPREWNHLVGYDAPRDDAKLIHFTMGIPPFPETEGCEYAEAWRQEHQAMNSAAPWAALMGQSVHAARLPDGRVLPMFHPDVKAMQARDRPASA